MSKVTYERWNPTPETFSTDDCTRGARAVLQWAYRTYSDEELVYSSSFGAEAIVLIDLIHEIKPDARIVFLDTGLHFPQTYEVIEKVEARFPSLRIERLQPELSLGEQALQHGDLLWQSDPNQCCRLRKVLPLQQALSTKLAWISGLRRDQSPTRASTEFINRDEKFRNIKICPLIHWTWEDVWRHIRSNALPYNALHDQQYPSIGCFPCTKAALNGTDSRDGRWTGFGKTECGLHTR